MVAFSGEFQFTLEEDLNVASLLTGSAPAIGGGQVVITLIVEEVLPKETVFELTAALERGLDNVNFQDLGSPMSMDAVGVAQVGIDFPVPAWVRLRIGFVTAEPGARIRGRFEVDGASITTTEQSPMIRLVDPCRAGFFFPASYAGGDACT